MEVEKRLASVPRQGQSILIDWFACTFDQDKHSINDILNLLNEYTEIDFNSGLSFIEDGQELSSSDIDLEDYYKAFPFEYDVIHEIGYTKSLKYGNMLIFYGSSGKHKRGYKLSFSGQGVRQLELWLKEEYSLLDFIRACHQEHETNITRLDIALDDFKGHFTVNDLHTYVKSERLVTKFRDFEYKYKADPKTLEKNEHMLTLGTRKSRTFFRIYDKALEQGFFHENDRWVRVEMELKNENAENALNFIWNEEDTKKR